MNFVFYIDRYICFVRVQFDKVYFISRIELNSNIQQMRLYCALTVPIKVEFYVNFDQSDEVDEN